MEEGKTKQIDGHKIVMTTIFIVVTAVIFLAIGFMAGKNSATSETTALESATATSTVSINTSATTDETTGWKTATLQDIGLTFKYPSDWGSYEIKNATTETGTSKYVKFSNGLQPTFDGKAAGIETATISYVSEGSEAGRSGTIAEVLSYRKAKLDSIKTCAGLEEAMEFKTSDCSIMSSAAGDAVVGKTTIFEDEAFGVIAWQENPGYPYFSIQRIYKSSADLTLIKQILSTFQLTK